MKKKSGKKARFLAAYDERGNFICYYLPVRMKKGKSAVLPITKRLTPYFLNLLSPYFSGKRKVVWRGWTASSLKLLLVAKPDAQEAAFYNLMRPIINNSHRRVRKKVLKRIGAMKLPKTQVYAY